MKTRAAGKGPVFTTADCFKATCRERPDHGSEGGKVRAHGRETEISDRGNILMFDKGVGLNLRNESQRRVQNELIDADSMSVIGRMACSISHDMRHSLSAIYANAEFLERHDLCASERVGQFSHVALYDHGKSQVFGMSDGVPPGAVCTIYHDRAGNVWAGGRGGQSKFENGRFRPLSKSNGLPAQSVFGMVEDDEGYWWLATEVGVLRIPAGELDRAVANPAYRIRYESFNTVDGPPGSPQNTFPGRVARTAEVAPHSN
jgi:hypothetical protein